MASVLQPWVQDLSMMQQTVLLTAIRGPDGVPKYESVKYLLRWFRRCVVISAINQRVLTNPYEPCGGSFNGPSFIRTPGDYLVIPPLPNINGAATDIDWRPAMNDIVANYLRSLDGIPHHFQLHLMHAIQIVGYKHPDPVIQEWWHEVYLRLVNDMHLHPESEEELDQRLGDTREGWLARADPATAS